MKIGKETISILVIVVATIALVLLSWIAPVPVDAEIPSNEMNILLSVADEYDLARDEIWLLLAIREAEQGGAGREMGVLTPQAQRFKGDFERSLRCQAQWAAGTIKIRYTGDLKSFADIWCPTKGKSLTNDEKRLNIHWLKNAKYFMEKYRRYSYASLCEL